MAALFSASTTTAVTSNPAANAGLGGAATAHIARMRAILQTCGGQILGLKVNKTIVPTSLVPIASTQTTTTALIG